MPAGLSNAISGLSNFQKLIDVVGNNIANLNTPGYKASNVTFKELMTQTIKGASAATATQGGTNPIQLGLGTTLGAVEQSITQGPIEITGKSTDFAITGGGYFIIKDGQATRYSRSGNFSIDSNGDLVNATGMKVQGWTSKNPDGSVDITTSLASINIPLGQAVSAKATENMFFSGNLSSSAAVGGTYSTKVTSYDAMGGATELTFLYTKTAVGNPTAVPPTPSTWSYAITAPAGAVGGGSISYDSSGKYSGVTITTPISFTPANGAALVTIKPDFTLTSQLDTGVSTVVARNQDGAKAGSLETFTVDSNGLIVGNFTNGNTENLGQIALASFTNPVGLNKVEGGLYVPSANSGTALVGAANSGSRGSISSSALEQSNVDLGSEFTKMIIAQRAFQANSRIVTTYDEILNEVANLKR
jgi:flagellar hook protein FlgE